MWRDIDDGNLNARDPAVSSPMNRAPIFDFRPKFQTVSDLAS